MKKLTIISPLYNEEAVVEKFYTELKKELLLLKNYTSKILFVVDGGRDKTVEILRKISTEDSSVSALYFSKNFGHQMALLAGIDNAEGDVIIMMDGDLQHPPKLIHTLLAEYEKGNDVVYTIRKDTEDATFKRKLSSKIFYKMMNLLSDTPIIEGAADFRLISRRVANVIKNDIRERNLFLRGVISWVGFRQVGILYVAEPRAGGASKYSLFKLLGFAIFGVISFSKKPLRAATVVGFVFAIGGFAYAGFIVTQAFIDKSLPPGWATVVVLLSIFSGVQLVFLGIIGEYIGGIFDEVKNRPHYIIEEKINF